MTRLLPIVLLLAGCAENPPELLDVGRPRPKGPNVDAETTTHVIISETEYYTSGPQQGRPPDGKFAVGTPVTLIEDSGDYSLVRSDSGIEGYVSTDALRANEDAATELVSGNNQFACDLYAEISKEDGNLFFSPNSISTAFAMSYAGARGETADEMANTLHFDLPAEQLHPAFAAMRRELMADAAGYELAIANRLWGEKDYSFLPEFLAITREQYGAELAEVNFAERTEEARQQINEWVEEQTQDKISNLIPQGAVDSLTRVVLTNAIYFKGKWKEPFRKNTTRDAPFHISADEQIMVPMMNQMEHFKYGATDDLQILDLPYGKEQRVSMVVLLPKKVDGLPDLEKTLTDESLEKWTSEMRKQEVRVSLPKFKMESTFQLNDTLAAMGMPLAFDRQEADFSGMSSGEQLYISAAIHKAFVDVNEEGTEAAAATGIAVGATSLGPEPPVFRADHPFVFLIHDNQTRSILFIGRFVDPIAR